MKYQFSKSQLFTPPPYNHGNLTKIKASFSRGVKTFVFLLFVSPMLSLAQTPANWDGTPNTVLSTTMGAIATGTVTPDGRIEAVNCNPNQNGIVSTLSDCGILPPPPNGSGNPPVEGNGSGGTQPQSPLFDLKIYPFPTNNKPLYLGRTQAINGVTAPVYTNRFVILPNGLGGLNIDKPRVAWDVLLNTNNSVNVPIAIFGCKNPAIGGNPADFTRHFQFIPRLGVGAYNEISQSEDFGLFFTDGLQNEGSNANAGLVIAPFDKATGTTSIRGIRITPDGDVGIGTPLTTNPFGYRLAVNGTLGAKEVNIEQFSQAWPDYVFTANYKLLSLYEVEKQIDSLGHLIGIPSAKEVQSKGLNLGENQRVMLEKIEELTLYMIELKKQNDLLLREMELLKSKNED